MKQIGKETKMLMDFDFRPKQSGNMLAEQVLQLDFHLAMHLSLPMLVILSLRHWTNIYGGAAITVVQLILDLEQDRLELNWRILGDFTICMATFRNGVRIIG